MPREVKHPRRGGIEPVQQSAMVLSFVNPFYRDPKRLQSRCRKIGALPMTSRRARSTA
jgi:hypothetical protein